MPMTDAEILNELGTDSLLNRVRRLISSGAGKIESARRNLVSPIALRRMEFEQAQQIIDTVQEEPTGEPT